MINNWWSSDPDEKYWMEIRSEREGLGSHLIAPTTDASGRPSWSYALTTFVEPNDRVFHWQKTDSGEPGIVAWSIAGGPVEIVPLTWQARGSRGRARSGPTTGPAWRVPLTETVYLSAPITRTDLNLRRADVLTLLEAVADTTSGPVYAPFQNYGGRELRAQQGYLTKFPAALVRLLLNDQRISTAPAPQAIPSQGFLSDPMVRRAVEQRAVALAREHYLAAGAASIGELGRPYDLRVRIAGEERHVEVKGATGDGVETVNLTQGEVDHARLWQPTDLFVVDSIRVTPQPDGTFVATGGHPQIWTNWQPFDSALRPTHLRYTLPKT